MKTTYILHRSQHNTCPQETHFSLNYEDELTAAQYEVVKNFYGPILVVAGAGSGKTRTLTYRVARMIERGIPPETILLLTFTRKASQEMLSRAAALLDSRCEKVAGGTYHSFGNMVLRRYGKAVGLRPEFSILDQGDTEDVIKLLLDQGGSGKKGQHVPNKKTLQAIFSKAMNKDTALEEIVGRYYPNYLLAIGDIQTLFRQFRAHKLQHQLLDYDDLLVYTRTLLQEHEHLRRKLSDRYRYIMVDEYQDTNPIQAQIVRLLADTHDNVMAVGDEAQSIYSFRGADYRNIMEFPRTFPGTTIIKLEENFRSVQPILNVSNDVISQARESFEKHLFTRKNGGALPVLVPALNERQQSQFVAQRILELQDEGVPLSDMAVLFRSSSHSFDLELELNNRNIRFVKVGGIKFIEAAHIKDILAHLRVLINPLDIVSWRRILLLLNGIGPRTASKIITQIQAEDNAPAWLADFPNTAKYTLNIQRLGRTLAAILDLSPAEQVQALREYYSPILHSRYDDAQKRDQDLEQLHLIIEQFSSLERFLTEMSLEPPSRSIDDIAQTDDADEELLTLSTIHSAKGLEWHSVFVIWLLEGRFPSVYSVDDHDALEEERRLLYVAATRAMTNLYLTYPSFDTQWGNSFSRPSRFLQGISRNHLDLWSLLDESDRYSDDDTW
ncbi:ATP-dependent DNA helicase [candidate division KSB3 bacterium]|uniref:DNA 3'-5' helicase n=1 Tax=candidate division KSB3 bacterium TaxID=2044937 RepID=A0A2G6E574_9BACT|nr:MAG: ATP-dependent DNA helicase [candidate division KSB3 bacterium]PIE29775.1 MAG: ATP-dependent DNA helicase [candidate division KSB3 bacterium]